MGKRGWVLNVTLPLLFSLQKVTHDWPGLMPPSHFHEARPAEYRNRTHRQGILTCRKLLRVYGITLNDLRTLLSRILYSRSEQF